MTNTITKLHFNGVDYDVGAANIHGITEKNHIEKDDELLIADSWDSYNNKKVKSNAVIKPSFFGGWIQGLINSQNYWLGWTDNKNLIPCIWYYSSSNYTYIAVLKDWFHRNANWNHMYVSFPKATFQNNVTWYLYCWCWLYQGYVYAVWKIDNSTYWYIKCSVDQMYDAAAWTKHTLSSSEQYMWIAWFNNWIIYVYKTSANILYWYRLSDSQLVETIDLTSINYSTYTPYMSDNTRVPYKIYGNNIYVQWANSNPNPINIYKVNKTTLQVTDSLWAANTMFQIRFNIVDWDIYMSQFYNASSAQLPWTYLWPA